MIRPLFAITDDLIRLNDLLDDIEGDLSRLGEMEPAVTGWLELLGEEQAAKLDGYIHLIRTLQMEAAAAKAEEEQWAAKRKARESREKYLETKLLRHLESTGQTKVTTASGRVVSVVKNGGVAPVTIDNAAVRAALADGRELPFAELLPRGNHLKVK